MDSLVTLLLAFAVLLSVFCYFIWKKSSVEAEAGTSKPTSPYPVTCPSPVASPQVSFSTMSSPPLGYIPHSSLFPTLSATLRCESQNLSEEEDEFFSAAKDFASTGPSSPDTCIRICDEYGKEANFSDVDFRLDGRSSPDSVLIDWKMNCEEQRKQEAYALDNVVEETVIDITGKEILETVKQYEKNMSTTFKQEMLEMVDHRFDEYNICKQFGFDLLECT